MPKQKSKDLAFWKDFAKHAKKKPKSIPDYSNMSYEDIGRIAQEFDPLPFWEKIRGMVALIDGETLRYILYAQIPLEKFIRFELAARGFDEKHRWCGFEKAEEIWLNENNN